VVNHCYLKVLVAVLAVLVVIAQRMRFTGTGCGSVARWRSRRNLTRRASVSASVQAA